VRPDLLLNTPLTAKPIPLDIPLHLQKSIDTVEGVGEPTNACFLTRDDMDPTGWLCSVFFVYE
jgi:hypothetical protein